MAGPVPAIFSVIARMTRRSGQMRWIGLACTSLVALAQPEASLARDDAASVPVVSLPDRFEGEAAPTPIVSPNPEWWRRFADPHLNGLMDRLHAGNTGIQQAMARLAGARAAARGAAAARGPFAGIDSSATYAGGPLINAAGGSGNLFTARASAGWEADLLGKTAGDRAADRRDVEAEQAVVHATRLLVEAEIARLWFAGRSLALAAGVANRALALEDAALAIVQQRRKAGLVSEAALDAAQERRNAARSRAADLDGARDSARRQIGFLLGETSGPDFGPDPDFIATPLPAIPAGLPADLLARRPDIAEARLRLISADARLRSARKGWLPVLGLTAAGGAASPSLGQLLSSAAGSFGIGALLSIPLFDGGRQKARVAGRKAARDLAEARYREVALAALRDVNNRLQQVQGCRANLAAAAAADELGAKLVAQASARQAHGTISDLLSLQTAGMAADRNLNHLRVAGECLVGLVELQEALGGGW